jgi:hypothetical protein
MPFVTLGVETEKEVFNAGTKAGQWGFWVNNIFGELIAGPKTTPNKSIIFQVEREAPGDVPFVAFAVRLDREGNRLGLRRFKIFTLDSLDNVIINEIEFFSEIGFVDDNHPNLFGAEILPVNNDKLEC